MPPVVIAAGVAAVGSLAAAKISSDASKKATDATSTANANALAFEKQKLANAQANYNAYNAMKTALLHRYGVDLGPTPAPGGGAMPGVPGGSPNLAMAAGGALRRAAMGQPPATPPAPMTIGDMAQGVGAAPASAPGAGGPVDLGSWNDWRRQGIA